MFLMYFQRWPCGAMTMGLPMKSLRLSLLTLAFASSCTNCPQTPTSTEGEGEVDPEDCVIPQLVDSDLTIPTGCVVDVADVVEVEATLTLEPGVELRFGAAAGMLINEDAGALVAIGTEDDPILLTGDLQQPGSWSGIAFGSSNPRNELAFVTVAFGGGDSLNIAAFTDADVYVRSTGRLQLSNCTFSDSEDFGLAVEDGARLDAFAANTFANNDASLVLPSRLLGAIDAASDYDVDAALGISAFASVVDEEQTWPAVNVPVVLSGITSVTATLTIAAGATFQADADAGILVNVDSGALVAVGTAADPIVFTGLSEIPGFWLGIGIGSSNNPLNELAFVTVAHGGAAPFNIGGAVAANVFVRGELSITDSTLRDSDNNGLVVEDGAELDAFANNTFADNVFSLVLPTKLLGSIDDDSDYDVDADRGISAFASTVDSAQTWPAVNVPIVLSGITTVTAPLTIAAGTSFQADADAGILVNVDAGALVAVGTAQAPIVFTGLTEVPGFWRGIGIGSSNNPLNELAFVTVAHGGAAPFNIGGGVAANVFVRGELSITNSTLRDSENNGLVVEDGAELEFANNTFADNVFSLVLPTKLLGSIDDASDYDTAADRGISAFASTVDTAQTWPATNTAIVLSGITTVTAALTIAAGATFQADTDAGILVNVDAGALIAIGTAQDPIVFTGLTAIPGFWRGIGIGSSDNPLNELAFVTVAHGGRAAFNIGGGVAADVFVRGTLRLSNSTLRDSAAFGLFVEDGGTLSPANAATVTFSGNVTNQRLP